MFDTGPLLHFAKSGWMGALKAVVGDRTALIPDVVVEEVRAANSLDDQTRSILNQAWLTVHPLASPDEIMAFAKFSALLVARGRNRGEAGVLALALCMDGVAVIDDMAGRKAATREGIALTGTLGLLCDAIREGLLTVRLVSTIADDLMRNDYRLPFEPGGSEKWVADNGLLN